MRWPRLFRPRPDVHSAARALAREGAAQRRAKVRAKVDEMRRDMGMQPIDWSAF